MIRLEAPGKLNLSLLVGPPRDDGYHPLDSVVQTIEWCDTLELEPIEDDTDTVTILGAELDPEDDLVRKALSALREEIKVPPLAIRLEKSLPLGAGLGGGSTDAAAAILGAGRIAGIDAQRLPAVAIRVGADVPLFLTGGTLRMGGVGDLITPLRALTGLAVAVVVPRFGLSTSDVYRKWDEMEGPIGPSVDPSRAPPALRDGMPLRNDLVPAAITLEPMLGDFMADVSAAWGSPVFMTGSGSACFGYFPTVDEASDAATAVGGLCEQCRGADLRPRGVLAMVEGEGGEDR
jgi:4-diphosphocytidyl-2-C-methyl-D-erythritol kinase